MISNTLFQPNIDTLHSFNVTKISDAKSELKAHPILNIKGQNLCPFSDQNS